MTNLFNTARALATVAAFTMMVAIAPAHAEDGERATRMVVTSDLDLHTQEGAATLRHRVRIAARTVCGEPAPFASPEGATFSACVENAEQTAMKTSDALIASIRSGTRYAAAFVPKS